MYRIKRSLFCVVYLALSLCTDPAHGECDPKSQKPLTSAYHIDGGGWKLVRRVKQGPYWHPSSDGLAGTDSYGTATTDETADETFSIPFSATADTEFLFATGNTHYWLIATGSSLGGAITGSYYSNVARTITKSSSSSVPYSAKWYNREAGVTGNWGDPWIGMTDHNPSDQSDILYAQSSPGFSWNVATQFLPDFNGANVFVRTSYDGDCATDSQAPAQAANQNATVLIAVGNATTGMIQEHTDAIIDAISVAVDAGESEMRIASIDASPRGFVRLVVAVSSLTLDQAESLGGSVGVISDAVKATVNSAVGVDVICACKTAVVSGNLQNVSVSC